MMTHTWKRVDGDLTPPTTFHRYTGLKRYELTNHLGNVLTVISDRKIGRGTNPVWTPSNYYTVDVIESRNYYPFGMVMPGRDFVRAGGDTKFRYGFNGKENDDEIRGDDNHQDYGMRVSDPCIGRFMSVDPIAAEYPMLTPLAQRVPRS